MVSQASSRTVVCTLVMFCLPWKDWTNHRKETSHIIFQSVELALPGTSLGFPCTQPDFLCRPLAAEPLPAPGQRSCARGRQEGLGTEKASGSAGARCPSRAPCATPRGLPPSSGRREPNSLGQRAGIGKRPQPAQKSPLRLVSSPLCFHLAGGHWKAEWEMFLCMITSSFLPYVS